MKVLDFIQLISLLIELAKDVDKWRKFVLSQFLYTYLFQYSHQQTYKNLRRVYQESQKLHQHHKL